MGVGLNSAEVPGRDSSCWKLVLQEPLVGLDGGGRWMVLGEGRGGGMRWVWGVGGATQLGGRAMVIS